MMNFLFKGEFEGMSPHLKYEKYPLSILRPLAYVEEKEIIAYVEELGLLGYTCSCDFSGDASARRQVRKQIAEWTQGKSSLKANVFNAAKNLNFDAWSGG